MASLCSRVPLLVFSIPPSSITTFLLPPHPIPSPSSPEYKSQSRTPIDLEPSKMLNFFEFLEIVELIVEIKQEIETLITKIKELRDEVNRLKAILQQRRAVRPEP